MPKSWIVGKAGANKARVESPLGSISRVGVLFGRYKKGQHRFPEKSSVIRNFSIHRAEEKELSQRYKQASVPGLGLHATPYCR